MEAAVVVEAGAVQGGATGAVAAGAEGGAEGARSRPGWEPPSCLFFIISIHGRHGRLRHRPCLLKVPYTTTTSLLIGGHLFRLLVLQSDDNAHGDANTRLLFAGIICICQALQKAKQELTRDAEGSRHPQCFVEPFF